MKIPVKITFFALFPLLVIIAMQFPVIGDEDTNTTRFGDTVAVSTNGVCVGACPTGSPANNVLVVRDIYALSSNCDTKLADWVAYRVSADTIGPSQRRTWRPDPALDDTCTLEPTDYKGAHAALGTDRGHQAPLASFAGTDDWATTNYLSNITPQKSGLNQGPWKRLEQAVRDHALVADAPVYVVTGPLYERDMPALPMADEPHKVPSGYWKVVAAADGRVAAFVFDQDTPRAADYCDHMEPLAALEQRVGLDILGNVSGGQAGSLSAGLACGVSPQRA